MTPAPDSTDPTDLDIVDREPSRAQFRAEVCAGLDADPRTLPCKWFYDERGSELFDAICALEEYYPTRTEMGILDAHAAAMAAAAGPRCVLIEPGAGSLTKTRRLLEALERPAAYVPVDISGEYLTAAAAGLNADYPQLPVLPVIADFTRRFELPPVPDAGRRVVFFPGSTIGNFVRPAAEAFLRELAAVAGPDGGILLGVDRVKDPEILVRAYDDAAGVTAAFNRNLLDRINRELGGDFDVDAFAHRAVWNPDARRIEMHLVAETAQNVRIGDDRFRLRPGEPICTEYAHKYTPDDVGTLAAAAGCTVTHTWTDAQEWFGVYWLAVG